MKDNLVPNLDIFYKLTKVEIRDRKKKFSCKTIAPGRIVDGKLLGAMELGIIREDFREMGWLPLMELEEWIYDDLVRKFYTHLVCYKSTDDTVIILKSKVGHKDIIVTERLINEVLGTNFEAGIILV